MERPNPRLRFEKRGRKPRAEVSPAYSDRLDSEARLISVLLDTLHERFQDLEDDSDSVVDQGGAPVLLKFAKFKEHVRSH